MVFRRPLTMTLNIPMFLFCLVAVINNIILSNARQLKTSPDEKVVIGGEQREDQVDPISKNSMATTKKEVDDEKYPFPFPYPFAYPPQVPGLEGPVTPVPGLPFPISPPSFDIPGVPSFPLPPIDIPVVPSFPLPPIDIPGVPSLPLPPPSI